MRALTLWPEWAWAICYLGKRVENRPRHARFYGLRPGMTFAIHAGAHIGGKPSHLAAVEGMKAVWDAGKLLACSSRLSFDKDEPYPTLSVGIGDRFYVFNEKHYPAQSVVAVATFINCSFHSREVFGFRVPGQWGFELENVRVLDKPVSCSVRDYPGNRQGLWTLPSEVEAKVNEQLS